MSDRELKPGGIREFLQIAFPLAISNGAMSVMLVTDRMYLSWYSVEALAASMPSGLIYWTLLSLCFGTVGYLNVFVAQYFGAGRLDRIGLAIWQGVFLAVLGAMLFVPAVIFAKTIFTFAGYAPRIVELETANFQILGLGALPATLNIALACIYIGRGKTMPILYVNTSAMIFNVIASYPLIFGHWGFPEMGIRGAALGTVLASCLSCVCWVGLFLLDPGVREFGLAKGARLDLKLMGRIVWFGLPNGISMFLESSLFNVFLALIGGMGKVALAATNLAFALNMLPFVPMVGFMIAVETLVGRRIGEGRPDIAERTTWNALKLCLVYMAFWVIVYLAFPVTAVSIFTAYSDPDEFAGVESVTIMLLRFVAAFTLLDGVQIVLGGAIRGAGDTRFSMIFYIGSQLLVLIIPAWIAVRQFGAGLPVIWGLVVLWVFVLAVGFTIRFVQGKWKSMKVIESALPDEESADAPPADSGQEFSEPVRDESSLGPPRPVASASPGTGTNSPQDVTADPR